MDSLKIVRSAVILAATALSACASTPAPVAHEDRVPPQLVPAGYTQDECKYDSPVKPAAENAGGFSGSSTGAVGQADTGGHRSSRPFHCKHTVAEATSKCFGDDGKEHPLQWCRDKAAADSKP